jgi:hypothetical protein
VAPACSSNKNKKGANLRKSRICPFLLVLISLVPVSVKAQSVTGVDGINGTPSFTTIPATSKTVPHWTSSFVYSGVTYPYTMVGTNPATNSTTTVDVVLIPIQLLEIEILKNVVGE